MEHTASPILVAVPARSGLHARRAAAARRRALLTVTLLLLTVATGVLAATTPVSAWFVLAPAVLLVAVLALGRRAVRANARADAAWEARERARRAAVVSDDVRLAGRPAPAVRPSVTGRAVKSSQSHTQMIARVRPPAAAASGSTPASAEGAGRARAVAAVRGPQPEASTAPADTVAEAPAGADAAPTPEASAATTANPVKAADQSAPASDTEWTSVPVPRPVYMMKSAAPRWEPAPLTAEMAQITLTRRAELAAGDSAAVVELVVDQAGAAETASETEASSDSLGVNLNSVLARRRAAGE